MSGQHLLELINDILDLSKIESGTVELREEHIDVLEVARSSILLLKARAQSGSVSLEQHLPKALPELWADRRRVKQILVNLLSNAVKFTPPGGRVSIKVWHNPDTGHVFQVGTQIGRVIERKRAEQTMRESREQMHAVMDAVPAMINTKNRDLRYVLMNRFQAEFYGKDPGQIVGQRAADLAGLEYGSYMESLDRKVIETGEPLPYFEEISLDGSGNGAIVLLVEASADARETVARLLKKVGYQVLEAENGQAALTVLREPDRIDLLFTGPALPHGMSGIALPL